MLVQKGLGAALRDSPGYSVSEVIAGFGSPPDSRSCGRRRLLQGRRSNGGGGQDNLGWPQMHESPPFEGLLPIGAARFAVDEHCSETFEPAKQARLLATTFVR